MRIKAHTDPPAPLVSHCTRIDKCAMEKFCINGQLRNKLFFIVIHRFSLVKAAMNAPRIGVNWAMVLTKRLNFFSFQLPKVEQRPQRPLRTCHLRRVEFFYT
jgi:hypothetical protein